MRIAIFVDGNNFYFLRKKLGWTVDLSKLISYYNTKGNVIDAYYYSAIDISKPLPKFIEMLPNFGFVLVSKPLKTIGYGLGAHRKGNMDIEIVLDMFNTIDTYDMAVLVSGDGDFERVLELLRARGKRFEVLSHPDMVARELLQVAGMHYTNITNLELILKYLPDSEDDLEDPQELMNDMGEIEEEFPI